MSTWYWRSRLCCIVVDGARNESIVRDVIPAVESGRSPLVLTGKPIISGDLNLTAKVRWVFCAQGEWAGSSAAQSTRRGRSCRKRATINSRNRQSFGPGVFGQALRFGASTVVRSGVVAAAAYCCWRCPYSGATFAYNTSVRDFETSSSSGRMRPGSSAAVANASSTSGGHGSRLASELAFLT